MADRFKADQKVGRVDSGTESKGLERLRKQFEQQVQKPQKTPKKAGPDKFGASNRGMKFFKSVAKRIDSSRVYQSFKLPGTDRVVRDLRNESQSGKKASNNSAFEVRDGKMITAKEKSYVNYLGDRKMIQPDEVDNIDKEIMRLLSTFEELLIERFEKGKKLERELEDGKPRYKKKSKKEWKSFFSKFLKRTVWKKSDLKSLQKFLFRGLVDLKKGNGKYALLIGDMTTTNGQVQKFARLQVLSDLMAKLQNTTPGSELEAEILKKAMEGDEFKYLALNHKHKERPFMVSKESKQGVFGEAKLEERVAQDLGIQRRSKGKGYKGPVKWEDKDEKGKKHAFVPMGAWERDDRKKRLLPKVLAYTVLITFALLIIGGLTAIFSFLL